MTSAINVYLLTDTYTFIGTCLVRNCVLCKPALKELLPFYRKRLVSGGNMWEDLYCTDIILISDLNLPEYGCLERKTTLNGPVCLDSHKLNKPNINSALLVYSVENIH